MRFATVATFGCSVLKSELAFASYFLLKKSTFSPVIPAPVLSFPRQSCHSRASPVIPAPVLSFPRKRESSPNEKVSCCLPVPWKIKIKIKPFGFKIIKYFIYMCRWIHCVLIWFNSCPYFPAGIY